MTPLTKKRSDEIHQIVECGIILYNKMGVRQKRDFARGLLAHLASALPASEHAEWARHLQERAKAKR